MIYIIFDFQIEEKPIIDAKDVDPTSGSKATDKQVEDEVPLYIEFRSYYNLGARRNSSKTTKRRR